MATNAEVAERWVERGARMRLGYGRSLRSRNMRTECGQLYSYSTVIGEIWEKIAILDPTHYSTSTSMHQSCARSALFGSKTPFIEYPLRFFPEGGDPELIGIMRNSWWDMECVVKVGRDCWALFSEEGRGRRIYHSRVNLGPQRGRTAEEMLMTLVPLLARGRQYLRQGDLYFVPTYRKTKDLIPVWWGNSGGVQKMSELLNGSLGLYAEPKEHMVIATHALRDRISHTVREIRKDKNGMLYARGTLRHDEHYSVKLPAKNYHAACGGWYAVCRSPLRGESFTPGGGLNYD